MKRRPRLHIWAPRLMLLSASFLSLQFGLGRAARSFAVRSGEAARGSSVEIGSSQLSLLDGKVRLNDLRIANPRQPGGDLLEADLCELELDAKPLLHKQAVVSHGRVSGLRLSAFADTSSVPGHNATERAPETKWFTDNSDAAADQWLAHLAERFQHKMVDDLQAVQRTESFCANWSTKSADLETRGQALNSRLADLQKSLAASQANPLRSDRFVADLPKILADLQKDFGDLTADFDKLPDQLESERRAIVAARRQDEELVRKSLALQPVEADALSAYLLRKEAVKPLDEVVAWLRWLRTPAPADTVNQINHSRGEDLLFAGGRPAPNLLVKLLELRGSARIAGQAVDLHGTLTNLSTQPQLADEPLRLRLETSGLMPTELQATIDRTHGAKRDSLLIDCQGIVLPQVVLGRSDQLAIAIAPSLGSLSVSLALDGDQLTGNIQLVQKNVRITPVVGGDFAAVPISSPLEETLGRIDSLATRVWLGGTLSEPKCTLWSNLGPAVAEAMRQALEDAGSQHAHAVLAEAGKTVDERLTVVERQMYEQQARWMERVTDARSQLQNVAASDIARDRSEAARVGRRLPSNSLLR